MKLLHIDSSIQGAGSASRAVSAAVTERLRAENAAIEIAYRDLAAQPLPHLTLDVLADPAGNTELQAFLAADIVVIGAGLYNFSIPSQLKAWLDRVMIAGQTFSYGPEGPVGLAGGKRVIVALARGGFYGAGTPAAPLEHGETYLGAAFGFIGIKPEFIIAEGVALGDEARTAAVDAARVQASNLAASSLAA
ncbi:FMN-dependent NADH-azoreductase [Sphingomonas sp. MS122]|uniref:FMN-dependent NADH-azoreductase n=1 Tax=Sphingomonas sp. MS122 TaxID=3412683 RepID=UPI003C2CDC83